jgi:hypothetical protein
MRRKILLRITKLLLHQGLEATAEEDVVEVQGGARVGIDIGLGVLL